MAKHLIFLSVPGLRPRDIDPAGTPALYELANRGAIGELTPTFPCLTSCVQASMWTGRPPGEHGVIANGFFHRERREVEFWVGRNSVLCGRQIWDELRDRGITSAAWHAQNIKDAAADFVVTPEPIHEPDGTTRLWCYSKPPELYQQILDAGLGHFPLQHYWGPLANIESTRWILKAALWLHGRQRPGFHWIYIPHLDYAQQKFGPNSPQAAAALKELDAELGRFFFEATDRTGKGLAWIVAGEYAMTDVRGAIHPNRVLRRAGLLAVSQRDNAEQLNLPNSQAFAMVDHQLAHIYVAGSEAERKQTTRQVVELFRSEPGVQAVYAVGDRAQIGMLHQRSGDVVLISDESSWFAYYWWLDDAAAPAFARTVDIHSKPGYDPVELFFDPASRGIPLNASLVKGSHGAPAAAAHQRAAVITSWPAEIAVGFRDMELITLCIGRMV